MLMVNTSPWYGLELSSILRMGSCELSGMWCNLETRVLWEHEKPFKSDMPDLVNGGLVITGARGACNAEVRVRFPWSPLYSRPYRLVA